MRAENRTPLNQARGETATILFRYINFSQDLYTLKNFIYRQLYAQHDRPVGRRAHPCTRPPEPVNVIPAQPALPVTVELSSIEWVGFKLSCAYPYISMPSISRVFMTKHAPVIIFCVYLRVLNRPFLIALALYMRAGVNSPPSVLTIERRAVIGIHRVKPVNHSNTRLFFGLLSFLPCVITWRGVTSG